MTAPVGAQCRCCGDEIPPTYRHTEILVSRVQPSATTNVTGKLAAMACLDCAPTVAAGVLHRAQLWTPSIPCACHMGTLL